jgi:hemolysin III
MIRFDRMEKQQVKYYSTKEEKLNVLSHGTGMILSIIATCFLIAKSLQHSDPIYLISYTTFGLSLILLYGASTFYHQSKDDKKRMKLKIFDHAAIYVLIAGTYTPFTLITLQDSIGMIVFLIVWGIAIVGITLKLFFTGRFKLASTILYILMGWVIIFAINPLMNSLSDDGLFWLFSGGLFYTIGAIFYSIKKIKFNHAIFHFFVLFGSGCHFVAVYLYIV